MPFHVLVDDCGLAKSCQLLHIIWYMNCNMIKKKSEDFRPTVILAPQAVCTNWIDDARTIFPKPPEGLRVVTLYEKPISDQPISDQAPNFTSSTDLCEAVKQMDPKDLATGRYVIVSTY